MSNRLGTRKSSDIGVPGHPSYSHAYRTYLVRQLGMSVGICNRGPQAEFPPTKPGRFLLWTIHTELGLWTENWVRAEEPKICSQEGVVFQVGWVPWLPRVALHVLHELRLVVQ